MLSTTYVERLAARAGGWRARRLLAVFAEQPNPRALLSPDALAAQAGMPRAEANQILAALVREGLVLGQDQEALPPPDPDRPPGTPPSLPPTPSGIDELGYALLHPYLSQPVHEFCARVQRGRARARLSLRQRTHGKQLLRPHELLNIGAFLGSALDDQERDKVRRSLRFWLFVAGGIIAAPLVVLLIIYLMLSGSSYLHSAPAVAGVDRVVLRSGRPTLEVAFAMSDRFGAVAVDSGIALASLPDELSAAVRSRRLYGGLREANGAALPPWLERLLAPLAPVRRGSWLLLAGDKRGARVLGEAAKKPSTRRRALEMLALLAGDSPATREALLQCASDKRPTVRRMAVAEARRLGSGGLKALRLMVGDADAQVRLAALEALRALDPSAATRALAPRLRDADRRVQSEALAQLKALADKDPVNAFAIVYRTTARPRALLPPLAQRLERLRIRLLREHRKRLGRFLVRELAATRGPRRALLLGWLIEIADQLEPQKVLATVGPLIEDGDDQVRAAAIGLQARFGDGEQVMETLDRLSRSYTGGRKKAAANRRAAAVGLGLAQAAPRADRIKILKRLLKDPASPGA